MPQGPLDNSFEPLTDAQRLDSKTNNEEKALDLSTAFKDGDGVIPQSGGDNFKPNQGKTREGADTQTIIDPKNSSSIPEFSRNNQIAALKQGYASKQQAAIDIRKRIDAKIPQQIAGGANQPADTNINQGPEGLKSDLVPKVADINPDGDQFKTIKPTGENRARDLKPPTTSSLVSDTGHKKESETAAGDRKSSADISHTQQAKQNSEQQDREKQEATRFEQSGLNAHKKQGDPSSASEHRSDVPDTNNVNDESANHAAAARNQQDKSGTTYGSSADANADVNATGKNIPGSENVAGLDPSKSPGSAKFLRATAQENAIKSDLSQYVPTDGSQIPGQQSDFPKGQVDSGLPTGVNGTQGDFGIGSPHGTTSNAQKSDTSAWRNKGSVRIDNGGNPIPDNAVRGSDGKYYVPGQTINIDGSKRAQVQEQGVAGKTSSTAFVDNPEGSRIKLHEPIQPGSKNIEGTTRPGEIIDTKSEPYKGTSDGDRKPGAKLEVEINSDGKGKRIGLDGREIIGLDGKSSPLYPNQKGKRITRFVDQGKKIAPGRKPGGKSKIDPRADLDPKERAQIDKIIKQTDRIFFGEKSPKAKSKAGQKADGKDSGKGVKGDSRGESTGKAGNKGHIDSKEIGSKGKLSTGDRTRGDKGSKSKGDVRSGINSTKISKGDAVAQSTKSDAGKTVSGKGFGLPDYAPFPGLKLPEFKIKWPGSKGKVSDSSGKSGKGQAGGKRGFDGVKSTGKGTGNRGFDNTKAGDKGTGSRRVGGAKTGDKSTGKTDATKLSDKRGIKSGSSQTARINFEANTKSLNDNVSKIVSDSKQPVKLVRGLEVSASGKQDVRSARFPSGRQASETRTTSFKPTKVSMGTRTNSDATFVPSSIAIQPLDWSGIKGWFETRGILRVNKGQKGTERRPVGKATGVGVRTDGKSIKGDTATVKTKAGDTATVKTGSGNKAGDSVTVKTGSGKKAGDSAAVKTDASKSIKKGDASSRQGKPEKKGESKKAENKKFELKESKDAYNGKLPAIKMTYKAESGKVKSFTNKGSTEQSEVKPTKAMSTKSGADAKPAKGADKVSITKPGVEAKQTKVSEIAATNKKAGALIEQIQKDLRPVNSAKAGVAHVEALTPRSMRDMNASTTPREVDPRTGRTGKAETDTAKSKPEFEKGKFVVEGKDGRLILKDLAMTGGLKGGFSRRADRLLDGARIIDGAHIVSLHIGIQQAKPQSIRDVLAGFNLGKAKKGFTPEISESGSYKVTRNQSSAQLKAFGSSARHIAINFSMESSSDIHSTAESDLESQDNEFDGEDQKNIYRKQSQSEDEARKPYIVQVGDTVDSIAVVELNDERLARLIFELNEPLFQEMFDVYKQEHVKTLRTGTMILLPNKSDIENFKKA